MKWIAVILCVLLLLLFLPLSARLRYNSQLAVWAGVGRLRLKVYDSAAAKKEQPQEPELPPEKREKQPASGKKKRLDLQLIWEMIQALPGPLRRLLRRVHIHHVALRILTAGEDAADAAIRAGRTAGAVYSVYGLLCGVFTLDPPEVLVLPDFFREEDNVYLEGCVTVRPAALLAFLAGFAVNYAHITAKKGSNAPEDRETSTTTQSTEDRGA
ncbi:MAG: DUF2953 domain-containing protein [Clostridiales bacterium]|nr:DUF2953 domain-containing protein [Clostridiales bacterium]